jgi:hypothetical protein
VTAADLIAFALAEYAHSALFVRMHSNCPFPVGLRLESAVDAGFDSPALGGLMKVDESLVSTSFRKSDKGGKFSIKDETILRCGSRIAKKIARGTILRARSWKRSC